MRFFSPLPLHFVQGQGSFRRRSFVSLRTGSERSEGMIEEGVILTLSEMKGKNLFFYLFEKFEGFETALYMIIEKLAKNRFKLFSYAAHDLQAGNSLEG